jgi:hypothetical protein
MSECKFNFSNGSCENIRTPPNFNCIFKDPEQCRFFKELDLKNHDLPKELHLNLVLPSANIEGLGFDHIEKNYAVFDLEDDGLYHSHDIIFLSARNITGSTSKDLLTTYLETDLVKEAFYDAVVNSGEFNPETPNQCFHIENLSLPKENDGVKNFNGVRFWYWLKDPWNVSSSYFAYVYGDGDSNIDNASAVGGCAPAFRVARSDT